jgi:hypothetical protein
MPLNFTNCNYLPEPKNLFSIQPTFNKFGFCPLPGMANWSFAVIRPLRPSGISIHTTRDDEIRAKH